MKNNRLNSEDIKYLIQNYRRHPIAIVRGSGSWVYDSNGKKFYANHELVRLAIPRRTYTQSHIDYVIEVLEKIRYKSHKIKGLKIINESKTLRHFSAKLERE